MQTTSDIDNTVARGSGMLSSLARGFLHMTDVRLGAGDTVTQVSLWRGELSDITGWSFGCWNPKYDPGDE